MNATAETIEGTATVVREDEPQRGLAVVPEVRGHLVSGLGAVMALSDEDFDRNLEMLSRAKERAQKLQRALLTEGTDYGTVPGIPRPFLHKPGAEIFEKAYGLATSYEVERKVGDGVKTPELEYIVHAKVHLGDTDGPIVGEGLGSCNTHETKYRYRSAKRTCPDCGTEGLIKGKADGKLKGKWWCPNNSGGCGHTFEPNSPKGQEIGAQVVGQVENENPYDLANTILKMARKRAGVDAILTTTGTSGLFTQDDDSPVVQPSGGAGAAQASTGGADAGKAQRSTTGSAASTNRAALPKIPRDITESTNVGAVRLGGDIVITDKTRTDGAMREGPNGPTVGFQFEWPEGGKIATVVLRDDLAREWAEKTQGNPSTLHGTGVIVAGDMYGDPWTKTDDEGVEEQMPPMRRIEATSIEAEDWTLPAPAAAAEPEPKTSSKAKSEPKQTTVADAAHEASKPAGAGMTADAFNKALEAGRVAGAYALSVAKERFGVETLFALTDPQRLELASELGLLADEEE